MTSDLWGNPTVIAATGHRPNKTGGYTDAVLDRLVSIARDYIEREQPDEAISGMAQGWDTAWALAALSAGVPLTAALPFEGQESLWPEPAQDRWTKIVDRATRVVLVNHGSYENWKMYSRNVWMVDNCTKLCALWNGSAGGTANCISYAKKAGRPIDNLWGKYAG